MDAEGHSTHSRGVHLLPCSGTGPTVHTFTLGTAASLYLVLPCKRYTLLAGDDPRTVTLSTAAPPTPHPATVIY